MSRWRRVLAWTSLNILGLTVFALVALGVDQQTGLNFIESVGVVLLGLVGFVALVALLNWCMDELT